MESLLHASSSLVSPRPRIDGRGSFINPSRVCITPSLGRREYKSLPMLVATAKKKKSKKDDNHGFSVRPDEATGPFPESILLKEKKVDEEGDLLPEFADAEEKELYEFLDLQLQSDFNEETKFIKEKKGKVWRFSDWGMRRLAYKIHKAENAHYILMNFEMEAKYLNEFKGLLDSDERVIRHLVMKRDEAITEDCPPPPEFHSVRAGMDDDDFDDEEELDEDEDEDGENVEYEVDDDGNVVMVVYEAEEEEDGADETGKEQDQSDNARRENRRTVNVEG